MKKTKKEIKDLIKYFFFLLKAYNAIYKPPLEIISPKMQSTRSESISINSNFLLTNFFRIFYFHQ